MHVSRKGGEGRLRHTRLTPPPKDPMWGRPDADRLRRPIEGRLLPSPFPSDSEDGDSGCRGAATAMLLRLSKAVAEWFAIWPPPASAQAYRALCCLLTALPAALLASPARPAYGSIPATSS